jgi:hypothetical protein
MTLTQAKLLTAAGMLLAAWFFRDRPTIDAKGGVELGVPTVDGVYGGYYLTPHVDANADGSVSRGELATDPRMAELIARSNAAIAADDAAQGEP